MAMSTDRIQVMHVKSLKQMTAGSIYKQMLAQDSELFKKLMKADQDPGTTITQNKKLRTLFEGYSIEKINLTASIICNKFTTKYYNQEIEQIAYKFRIELNELSDHPYSDGSLNLDLNDVVELLSEEYPDYPERFYQDISSMHRQQMKIFTTLRYDFENNDFQFDIEDRHDTVIYDAQQISLVPLELWVAKEEANPNYNEKDYYKKIFLAARYNHIEIIDRIFKLLGTPERQANMIIYNEGLGSLPEILFLLEPDDFPPEVYKLLINKIIHIYENYSLQDNIKVLLTNSLYTSLLKGYRKRKKCPQKYDAVIRYLISGLLKVARQPMETEIVSPLSNTLLTPPPQKSIYTLITLIADKAINNNTTPILAFTLNELLETFPNLNQTQVYTELESIISTIEKNNNKHDGRSIFKTIRSKIKQMKVDRIEVSKDIIKIIKPAEFHHLPEQKHAYIIDCIGVENYQGSKLQQALDDYEEPTSSPTSHLAP